MSEGNDALTEAVARYLHKLMAYKDEYEVARLYSDGEFLKKLNAEFGGDFKLEFNLAPPAISTTDPATGRPKKRKFGPWMLKAFGVLAKMRGLRGTPFDIFGYTNERRMERALIKQYEADIDHLLKHLTPENHASAVKLLSVPDMIRGYGPVKHENIEAAKILRQNLMDEFENPETLRNAA